MGTLGDNPLYWSASRFKAASLKEWADQRIVEKVVSVDGLSLEHASDELKNEFAIVELAVKQNPAACQFASERLLQDGLAFASLSISSSEASLHQAAASVPRWLCLVRVAIVPATCHLQVLPHEIMFRVMEFGNYCVMALLWKKISGRSTWRARRIILNTAYPGKALDERFHRTAMVWLRSNRRYPFSGAGLQLGVLNDLLVWE
mmetsp:Transcript_62390/g.115813  ORF Transcript_62390/g.115813 Transcript_62390/m.115813 type:complete len:204 (-) Transcript_62390:2-613(-)